MKRLLALLVAGVLLAAVLVGCSNKKASENETEGETKHKHTFASVWTSDENGHWYAATCGCPAQANYAAHTDKENDGICDICAYGGDHEHTFAEEWSYDETNHWHAASCKHTVKQDEAPHADADNDGVCDGCAWNYDHEHTYEKAWSHDADNHWHALSCGHDAEVKGLTAHTDKDNNGICDGCQWDYDHTHTFAEDWSHNEKKHWKDTTCGHSVISEESEHVDENNDAICDGCGWDYDHTHTYASGQWWTINDTHHWYAPICGHDVDGINMGEHVDADENRHCDVCDYDYDHVHTFYTEKWSHDKNYHYHQATCGHAVRSDEEPHIDANNNGICDVCIWNYDHTHEFEEGWVYDSNTHWHAPTCTHSVKNGEEPHVDVNNDKLCDVCSWDYDHTHKFNTAKLVVGANTHYYAPSCGCNPKYVRDGEEEHVDKDRDDKCDICGGYVSLEVVVDNATSEDTAAKVKNGTITINHTASNYTGEVFYEFGDQYLHIKDHQYYFTDQTTNDNNYEYWYAIYDGDSIFAIAKEDGDPYRNQGAEAIFLDGYYFSGEFISYAFNCYGVEALVYQLYGMHISVDHAAACTNFVEYYDPDTDTYSFSFNYQGLYVGVSFKIDASFVLTDVEIVTGSSEVDHGDVITIKQTSGKQSAVNPYDPDVVLITSYRIVDANGKELKDGDTVNMITGSNYLLELSIKDLLPTTANPAFDRINISCSNPDAIYAYASTEGNMIVNAQKEGDYTVSFTTDRFVKTINISVRYPAPKTIGAQIYAADGGYQIMSECNMYLDEVLNFTAGVDPNTDKRYTAKITSNAANGTLADGTVKVLGNEVPVTVFTPKEVGDYTITITSAADPSVTCTLVVHVKKNVKIEDILNGYWMYDWKGQPLLEATFTPESKGARKGTVVIVDHRANISDSSAPVKTATFKYEYLTDGIQLTWVSGDEFSIKMALTADYQVKLGSYALKRTE